MSDAKLIHEQVQAYFAAHPTVASYTQIRRTGDGEYLIDGRDVKVGFCREGYLVVHDGPLRQPFTDYVEKKESTAVYHSQGLKSSTLNNLPKETRISFGDEGNRYSRLDAMKVAKEQAIFREKAANYTNDGQQVPNELRQKYDKTLEIKLGQRRRECPQPTQPQAPAWWPGAPATGATAAPAMQLPPQQQPQPQTQPMMPPQMPMPPSQMPMPPPQPQPQQVAPGNQRPQLPMPSVPPVGPPQQASLFGPMPDLFQMANARAQGTVTPVASPMQTYTGAGFGMKAPARNSVAGPLCGA